MKKLLAIIGTACSLALPANAEEVQFIGGLTIHAQAGTCPEGNHVGLSYLARFRPRDTALATPHSDLNLFSQGGAMGHRLPNGLFTATFKKVQATAVSGGSGTTLVSNPQLSSNSHSNPISGNLALGER